MTFQFQLRKASFPID